METTAHILVVDDEPDVLTTIQQILERAGYTVTMASCGQAALDILARQTPDLVILDIVMPEMDGIAVCQRIRATPHLAKLPVLFLTAKGRPSDVVEGLDVGGDDYLTKPFEVVELPARVRALLRRTQGGVLDTEAEYLAVGGLRLHVTRPEARREDEVILLTTIEHRLLHRLMMHPGQPIPTSQLLEDVWGYPPGTGNPNVVQVTIGRLRAKLEPELDSPKYIYNVHGAGYMVSE